MTAAPLIVTAILDRDSFEFFDALRRRHFPPERNFLSAHLTLFHNLPGDEIDSVKEKITAVSLDLRPFPVSFSSMRFMGRGVAVNVDSVQLIGLRRRLAAAFEPWLTPQDRQKSQPHITIQNKVEPREARELFEAMNRTFTPFEGLIEGVALWHYLGGPWELEAEFPFSKSSP